MKKSNLFKNILEELLKFFSLYLVFSFLYLFFFGLQKNIETSLLMAGVSLFLFEIAPFAIKEFKNYLAELNEEEEVQVVEKKKIVFEFKEPNNHPYKRCS